MSVIENSYNNIYIYIKKVKPSRSVSKLLAIPFFGVNFVSNI